MLRGEAVVCQPRRDIDSPLGVQAPSDAYPLRNLRSAEGNTRVLSGSSIGVLVGNPRLYGTIPAKHKSSTPLAAEMIDQ
jgi:hypothetical protein